MRQVDMEAALYSMGSRVGLGCVSQSDAPSQSLFTFLAGREQQCTDCGSRQKIGAQSRTMPARARRPTTASIPAGQWAALAGGAASLGGGGGGGEGGMGGLVRRLPGRTRRRLRRRRRAGRGGGGVPPSDSAAAAG